MSHGALGGLGVVGSRCLGSPGSSHRLSGPFSFATPSLSCSDPPSQLQPQFHPGPGFVRSGVRLGGEGGHRDRASFPWVLQSPLCHSQSHRGLVTGHRSLTPWVELSSLHIETAQSVLQSLRLVDGEIT